jgi:hypothetical protein
MRTGLFLTKFKRMKYRTKIAHDFVSNYFIALFVSLVLAGLVSGSVLAGSIEGSPWILAILVFVMYATATVQGSLYFVHRRNKAWSRVPEHLHAINKIYRQVLSMLYLRENKEDWSKETYLSLEQEILQTVCKEISTIFRRITTKPCQVIVYLLIDDASRKFCFTWATSDLPEGRVRSQQKCEFELDHARYNTRFQKVLSAIEEGGEHAFFCSDIKEAVRKDDYHDSLKDFIRHYQSVIVVPICCAITDQDTEDVSSMRVIGFLSVDSHSANRFTRVPAIHLLSAFADQMFNFISLMRREYVTESSTTNTIREGDTLRPGGTVQYSVIK